MMPLQRQPLLKSREFDSCLGVSRSFATYQYRTLRIKSEGFDVKDDIRRRLRNYRGLKLPPNRLARDLNSTLTRQSEPSLSDINSYLI